MLVGHPICQINIHLFCSLSVLPVSPFIIIIFFYQFLFSFLALSYVPFSLSLTLRNTNQTRYPPSGLITMSLSPVPFFFFF